MRRPGLTSLQGPTSLQGSGEPPMDAADLAGQLLALVAAEPPGASAAAHADAELAQLPAERAERAAVHAGAVDRRPQDRPARPASHQFELRCLQTRGRPRAPAGNHP